MLEMILPVAVVAALVAWVVVRLFGPQRSASSHDAKGLPPELAGAQLLGVERDATRLTGRYALTGRYDQAWTLPSGQVCLIERKSRANHRVYPEDVAELSLQAFLLRDGGAQTTPFGFVLTGRDADLQYTRVRLLGDAQCEQLIDRYLRLKTGSVDARPSPGPKCARCDYASRCEFSRRGEVRAARAA